MDDQTLGQANEPTGTLFLKDITKLDCALFDMGQGVIGQSWHVDVTLTGNLDDNGFVYDFSHLKKLVRQVMKSSLDHALLIPVGSQSVHFNSTDDGEHWHMHAKARLSQTDFQWEYTCPKGAVYPVRCLQLNQSIIEQEFTKLLRHRLPESIHKIAVKLRDEYAEPTEAFFRYTHGIGGHEGLCQRLFHGHRSRIEVYFGDERRPDLEHFVAREVFGGNVHIATPSQIRSGGYEIGMRGQPNTKIELAFPGSLGLYEAVVPGDKVFVVEHETSIECISMHLAKFLKITENTTDSVRVHCYEGINKGAIGSA